MTPKVFIYKDGESKGYLSLQLGLSLGFFQNGLHLCSLHDVALDLELAAHKQTLSIGLAGDQGGEIVIGEGEGY